MSCNFISEAYRKYNLNANHSLTQHGKTSDTLGDVYEEYVLKIFSSKEAVISCMSNNCTEETKIISRIINYLNTDIEKIDRISSSQSVPNTRRNGTPKTDVVLSFKYKNGTERRLPISVKHSSQPKVSIAEYDVDTICSEVGINDDNLIALLKKHQRDGSAKNITPEEERKMIELLHPIKHKLVRWCYSMSPIPTINRVEFPEILIRFKVVSTRYAGVSIETIEECVNRACAKRGGFGTGLSWTYATGSKGRKIQFKG